MSSRKSILGEMRIEERDGGLVAIFKNKAQWSGVEVRKFPSKDEVTVELNSRHTIEYSHNALFGIGRNPIDSRFMHEEDQQKIIKAKNTMIEYSQRSKSEDLIRTLDLPRGLITPRR